MFPPSPSRSCWGGTGEAGCLQDLTEGKSSCGNMGRGELSVSSVSLQSLLWVVRLMPDIRHTNSSGTPDTHGEGESQGLREEGKQAADLTGKAESAR